MGFQEKYPVLVSGEWVPICEQYASRESLIVSMIGGAVVLGVNTAAPLVTSAFGQVPAGIFLQGGDVSGPGVLRVSQAIDTDLVSQEWFAWLVPGSSPGGGLPVFLATMTANTFGGGNASLTVPYTAGPGQLVAMVWAVCDGPFVPNVTVGGGFPANVTAGGNILNVNDYLGSALMCNWLSPNGPDAVVAAMAGPGWIQCDLYFVPESEGQDASATNQGAGNPVTLPSVFPIAFDNGISFAGFLNDTTAVTLDDWPAPWVLLGSANVIDDQGVSWGGQLAYLLTVIGQIVTLSLSPSAGTGDWTAVTIDVNTYPDVGPAVIAVFESYEIVDAGPPLQSFDVTLPRLSPQAFATLASLQRRVQG